MRFPAFETFCLEQVGEGVILIEEGIITLWNRKMEEITGINCRAMIGKASCFPFFLEEEKRFVQQLNQPSFQEILPVWNNRLQNKKLFNVSVSSFDQTHQCCRI